VIHLILVYMYCFCLLIAATVLPYFSVNKYYQNNSNNCVEIGGRMFPRPHTHTDARVENMMPRSVYWMGKGMNKAYGKPFCLYVSLFPSLSVYIHLYSHPVFSYFSAHVFQYGSKVCRYNWHSAGFLGWPFPMLKYKYTFHIKYTEAILSNSTRKLLWFEIAKMLDVLLQRLWSYDLMALYKSVYYYYYYYFLTLGRYVPEGV